MQVLKSTFQEYDNNPSDDQSVLMIQARNFFKMKSIDAFDPSTDDNSNSGAAIDAARKALFATVSSSAQKRLPHQRQMVSGEKAAAAVQGLPENIKSQQNQRSHSAQSSKGMRKSGNIVSMQESDICITRIKQANWLAYLCFEPNISEFQQRQRAKLNLVPQLDRLLRNAIDLLDVQDAAAVNAVLEQSASMHANRAKQKNPLKKDRIDITDPESIIQNELKQVLSSEPPLPPEKEDWRNEFKKLKKQTIASFKLLQSIPSHFIKVLYLLQHLKARDYKIRIMSYLNYFRSIQRRFALDIREFGSRDRLMADCQFIPPSTEGGVGGGQERVIPTGVKVQTEEGNNKSSANVSLSIGGGDGITPQKSTIQMNGTSMNTGSKADLNKNQEENLVTLRKYKHNGRLSFKINSTSPVLPKIHATVDSNFSNKQLSQEILDSKIGNDQKVKQLNNRINKYFFTNDRLIHVVDDFGVNIYYDIALQDMSMLEDQIIRIGTHYITQNEIFGAMKGRLPRATLDRMVICQDLLQYESEFYYEKVRLVQAIMDSYESVCDPLEQQRVIQMVTDIMAERPCLDLQATYFKSSYKSSIEALKFKRYFFEQLIKTQHSQQLQINSKMWTKMQAKCRKVAQYMDGKWRAAGQRQAMQIRKQNAEAQKQYLSINQQGGGELPHMKSSLRGQGSIGRRVASSPGDEDGQGRKHLSKYAHQTLDFAEVLGIPNITAQSILNLQDQKQPIVLQSLSQLNTYNKFKEGLPQKLHPIDQNTNKESAIELSQMSIGFTDFYESFGIIPRVYSISVWALEQLITIHRPQNGAARNSLEVQYYKHCTAQLKLIKAQNDSYTIDDKGMQIVTEGLVFDNPDVLQFAAKDLVAELSGDFDLMNPFHVAKLDCQSIQNYPFPQVPKVLFQYLPDGDVDETKPGIPMPPQSPQFLQFSKDKVAEKMVNIKRRKYKRVLPPTLLRVTCNIIELIRLREHLIDTAYETCILHHIDQSQRKIVNKASEHPIMKDQIHFQNFSDILVENYNFVDQGYGYKTSNTSYGCLAFTQFDPTLKNCLQLRNLSACKSLFLNAGLEEFRGILTYQLMHLQTVMISVQHNQHLMSYHQQATAEFDAVSSRKETPFITPNRVSNIQAVLSRSGDNINNEALTKERTKIKTNLVKQVADLFILANKKKSRSRNQVAKKLQIFHNKIAQKIKDYPKLRILRSYKIKLLHAYCRDMLREVYHDALKVQSMEIRNQLYNSQFQMPMISPLFTQKLSLMFQNVPYQLQGQIPSSREGMLQMNNLTSFYRLPAIEEIAKVTSMNDQDARSLGNCSSPYAFNDQFDERDLQLSIQQEMLTPPTLIKLKTNDATIFKRGDEMGGQDEDVLLLPRYKRIAYQKGNFQQAWQFGNRVYQMTRFLFYLHKLFELEMFIYKSMAGSQYQILELEEDVQRGYSFWDRLKENTFQSVTPQSTLYSTLKTNDKQIEGSKNNKRYEYDPSKGEPATAEHILQLIMMKKRKRINLSDELLNSVTGFQKMEQSIIKERRSAAIQDTNQVMQLLYEKRYLSLQLALQKMIEQLRQFKDPATSKQKKSSMARKNLPIAQNKQQLQRPLQHCNQILSQLSGHVQHSTLTYSNGFNITKCTISPKYLTFHQALYADYQQFSQAIQPMVDEQALVPQEISLTLKINKFSLHALSNSYFMGHIPSVSQVPRLLRRIMLGFTTAEEDNTLPASVLRQRVATRIASSQQDIQESLINLGQIKGDKQTQKEWILQRDYTSLCILSHNAKNVMMSFLGRCMLPDDVFAYQKLQQKYKQVVYWQVLAEQQRLQFILKRQKERQSGDKSRYRMPQQNELLAKGVILSIGGGNQQSESVGVRNDDKKNAQSVIMSMKAQISVVVNVMNLEMLKAANQCFQREISSLSGGLELGNKQIYALVHPQQQYASTVLQNVDKNSHLDVVQKVAPVQSFLTRLKNRCTEVETLTSGPGLVFTLKDFNDCVRQMSKGLVKYGEIQLKSRTETSNMRILHIQHLLYCKERQNQQLKRKIQKLTNDQQRIVNAKIAERGNQVIYQLDQSQRQLRMLKDNIFVLEMELRKALYMQYGANMRIKDVHIDNTERRFSDYKSGLTQNIKNFVLSNEKKILGNIEKIVSKFEIYKAGGGGGGVATSTVAPSRTSMNTSHQRDARYASQSHTTNLNTPQAVKSPSPYIRQVGFNTTNNKQQASQKYTPKQTLINRNDYIWPSSPLIEQDIKRREAEQNRDSSSFIHGAGYSQSMAEIQPVQKRLQVYDQDIREEYLMLHDFKRKLRVFWKFQFALQKSKYQQDLKRLEKQMTSNACLWDQLGQSQKRQAIIKQELMYTQQSLASCERIIDRLQSELDAMQNDKLRLQQFKNNKSKRLEELEQRVRHLEVLENIDLRKVLEELRSREKALKNLANLEENFDSRINAVERRNKIQMKQLQTKYNKEEEMKKQALDKLEALRTEVKSLEGYDHTADNWKEKCRELFEICKDFQTENRELRERIIQQDEIIRQNTIRQQQIQTQQQQHATSSVISGMIPERPNLISSAGQPSSSIKDHLHRKMAAAGANFQPRKSDAFSNNTRPSTEWNKSHATSMNFGKVRSQIGSSGVPNAQFLNPASSGLQTGSDFNKTLGGNKIPIPLKQRHQMHPNLVQRAGGSPIPPIYERQAPSTAQQLYSSSQRSNGLPGVQRQKDQAPPGSAFSTSHWSSTGRTGRIGTSSSNRYARLMPVSGVVTNPAGNKSFIAAGSAIAAPSIPGGKRSVSTSLKDSPSFQKMQTVKEVVASSGQNSAARLRDGYKTMTGGKGFEITGETMKVPQIRQNKLYK